MGRKILLVDDELLQLVLMDKLLKNAGFLPMRANSVDNAFKILEDEIPDLIISDIEMPEKDGFDFRKLILEDIRYKDIPFLFLTSHNDQIFIQRGLDLKAIDYIDKDIPQSQLLSKINNILVTVREQKEKSINDLKIVADKLNLKNVPNKSLKLKNFEVDFFHMTYQNHPGGDFIDFIKINDRFTFIVLGDVMGKKWGAWFFSFSFLSYIRSAIRLCVFDGNLSVAQIMQRINQVIHADDFLDDIFATLSLVLIDDEEGKITYSGASDLPVLRYQSTEKKVQQFKSKGLLLGFFENGNYTEQVIENSKGDQLFLLTDGAIDYESNGVKKTDINFFIHQLEDLLIEKSTFKEITTGIFNQEKYQVDDCSLISIKRI
ncbi:PP2C family protein-serine/threonine phosphatase [Pedobacter cryophilus]|uniref:Response regulator n=1 Tax=Pedobacter cryophilus TaxID=2571271 RepID=A0A4U1BZE5_9SPHI|nr:fused response regulator/phosphatase [Pedobacter cryophilus]TKB97901.1 response regulator [Pedobacter cryophilus]